MLLIEQRDKRAIIEQLAAGEGKTLVFARTRAFAEMLADMLDDAGIPAVSLHGDLNQSRRTRNLAQLTSGRVNVLVATDVAARGIHVDDIALVIQADAPDEYKTYLHRSGRTGRAGKVGTVVTLINKNRRRKMDELLGRAEIEASMVHVAPGDAVLDELAAQVTWLASRRPIPPFCVGQRATIVECARRRLFPSSPVPDELDAAAWAHPSSFV